MVVGFKKSELLTKSPSPKSIPTTYALEGTFQAGRNGLTHWIWEDCSACFRTSGVDLNQRRYIMIPWPITGLAFDMDRFSIKHNLPFRRNTADTFHLPDGLEIALYWIACQPFIVAFPRPHVVAAIIAQRQKRFRKRAIWVPGIWVCGSSKGSVCCPVSRIAINPSVFTIHNGFPGLGTDIRNRVARRIYTLLSRVACKEVAPHALITRRICCSSCAAKPVIASLCRSSIVIATLQRYILSMDRGCYAWNKRIR